MKIVSQSADELALREGNAFGIAFGVVFAIVGAFIGYYIRFALAFSVIGIAMIFLSSSITVDADKASGQIFYRKKRLIGGSVAAYAIADVFRIETRKQWRMESSNSSGNRGTSMSRPVLISQSVIVFKNGRELPLDHQQRSSSVGPAVLMGGQNAEVAVASQVANFLGVPFQEIAPPAGGIGINIGGGSGGIQL